MHIKHRSVLALAGLGSILNLAAWASPELDTRLAFKTPLVAVVGDSQDTVHGPYLQTEMEKFFQTRPRFEVSKAAFEAFQKMQQDPAQRLPDLVRLKEGALAPLAALASGAGADSLILAQVHRRAEEYEILLIAAALNPPEVLYQKIFPVTDGYSLQSFGAAARNALVDWTQGLPFDATVISREGLRVVLDRGTPGFRSGTRVPIFTLEKGESGTSLKQTGVILVQRVEKNLCFGTVLVENKPLEVTRGNKVRMQVLSGLAIGVPSQDLRPPILSRNVADVPQATTGDVATGKKEKSGAVEVSFVGSRIVWNRTAAGSSTLQSETGFYPGANLQARIKLTRDVFADLSGTFGIGSLASPASGGNLNSQYNQIRAQVGYQFVFNQTRLGPSVSVRAGYSRTQFGVDELPTILAPSSATFGGLLVGGGFAYPVFENFGLGLEMNGVAFPSLTEGTAGTSGASITSLSVWDFSLRGYYSINDKINIEARIVIQTCSAAFSGTGTRTVPLASLSQSTRAVVAGISYGF